MDAAAALKIWGYECTFDGVEDDDGTPYLFSIPPLPASEWIAASMGVGRMAYLPGLLDDDDNLRLMDALHEGQISMDDLLEANRDAIEVVSGWRWWEAGRIIGTLCAQWHTIGGLLHLSGVDPRDQPLGAVLAAVYARVWIDSGKEGRAKLAQQVSVPPPELLSPERWDEEAAEEALRKLMSEGATGLPG